MKVYVGSENPSKIEAVKVALKALGYSNADVCGMEADSKVGSKPVDDDIVKGARNRNEDMYFKCEKWDYLISIEGGIEENNGDYYLVTYAVVENDKGVSFEGKSIGVPVTKRMYEYYKSGKSINKLIDCLFGTTDNKKGSGISGFLSDDIFKRSKMDSEAVISALLPFENDYKYALIDQAIVKKLTSK